MFTGPVGPVEVFFYWPETVFGNFYWPGAIGSPLASSPVVYPVIDICGSGIPWLRGDIKVKSKWKVGGLEQSECSANQMQARVG